ncbi:hypothetical protein DIZ81_05010 [Legionella taurinensis]|uniref:Uncharacterized protein n=2 Tax=Legionella taurinensis TaxID=70611 RepID=A0A3A5LME9_9GAMM|nr:hypothetical protein [Legionella taurinensis]MDX1837034.1 hypothetical protein [Legionella taurinensis]PUT41438.1 hypothetical protein DB744_05010 [Legionella taurinensis]PUT42677.1 hypothetical protein DB746_07345 [Legionella taurinensis]PUT46705.1 hypothetical protein DB743_04745 [Legionella taurinensis]PUT47354.1 hypothetical protein DB745_08425 [Legionella taurinensis]
MKRNRIIGFMAMMSLANWSYADFTFYSNSLNQCESIAGNWAGKGMASSWLTGECHYHGAGKVSAVNSNGQFSIELAVDKDSGSFICPSHTTRQLSGTCRNGVVTIQTEYGNLNGHFSESTGNASGTLTVSPGMSAEVSVQFYRNGH